MSGQLQQPRSQLGPEDRPSGRAGRETGPGCGRCQAARPPQKQDKGLALNLVVRLRADRTFWGESVSPYPMNATLSFAPMDEEGHLGSICHLLENKM